MRILIDVGHPGDFHVFKNLAKLLLQNGHRVLFTTRQKEFEVELLRAEGLPFVCFGKHYKTLAGKLWGLIRFDVQMLWTAIKFRPDLFMSHGSLYAVHAAFLLRRKHAAVEDTGNMEQIILYRPLTDVILSPDVLSQDLGPKQVRYAGYHEIAYLHPDFFTPNPTVREQLGLTPEEPFAVVRFVSWNATHDIGRKGLSAAEKTQIVEKLRTRMKVFITSEAELPESLEPLRFKIPPEMLHHALSEASIVVSEGATVASEAGVLGTPAIYINPIPISYCRDQENYGLVFNTCEIEKVDGLIDDILGQDRAVFRNRAQTLLKDKVNVTRFLYDFISTRYGEKAQTVPALNSITN